MNQSDETLAGKNEKSIRFMKRKSYEWPLQSKNIIIVNKKKFLLGSSFPIFFETKKAFLLIGAYQTFQFNCDVIFFP